MKTFKLFAGAAAVLAMGALSACSSDEPIKGVDNGVAEVDETRYITVALGSPAEQSRAFDLGTVHESTVHRLDFFFYDNDGLPTGRIVSFTPGGDHDLKDEDFTDKDGGFEEGNVTRIWTSVVPIELTQGQNLPTQVVCLVNANPAVINNLGSLPLEDSNNPEAKTLTNSLRNYISQNGDFVMTNSVYYGTSMITGQKNARLCATPINAGQLYKTQDDALAAIKKDDSAAADKEAMVNIYVERLAAKIGLSMSPTAINAYKLKNGDVGDGSEVSITFVPQYWFMNAIADETFITKRYGVPGAGTTIAMDPGYEAINNNFKSTLMADNWNDAANHRSYWGVSPSYSENSFPKVSDQVNDLDGYTKDYPQTYYSFNEVKNLVKGATIVIPPAEEGGSATTTTVSQIDAQAIAYDATKGFVVTSEVGTDHTTGFIYTRETTTAISRINDIDNGNPAAAVGSAVLVGHYYVGATAPTTTEYTDFYVDSSNETYYGSMETARAALAERNAFIYSDEGTTPLTADQLTLSHPVIAVRDELPNPNIAGRLVTLQIAKLPTTGNYYYYNGANYVAITEANLAIANAHLAQGVGYLDMYAKGRAFFNIPVRHLGWRDSYYTKEGGYDWSHMQVGALGIVRNHVYSITVTGVSGIGTGLRSDDQPIVPPVETLKQYVAMRLNILSWNVVKPWDVEL